MEASNRGYEGAVKELLAAKADVNQQDKVQYVSPEVHTRTSRRWIATGLHEPPMECVTA